MPLNQAILPEFDHELANTRKTLERVPEDKLAWKPHAKSMSMGELATHLAGILRWTASTLQSDSFDTTGPEAAAFRLTPAASRQQLLEMFDKNAAIARAAIEATGDEEMRKPWALIAGGRTLFSMPRIAVLRSFVMNHSIHHRAQLTVYLRLNDVPVPSLYGPSADEPNM